MTAVIRAKLKQEVEFVGAVHRYWYWEIPSPLYGEVHAIDFGCSDDLAEAHAHARRAVQRCVALARWVKIREGL